MGTAPGGGRGTCGPGTTRGTPAVGGGAGITAHDEEGGVGPGEFDTRPRAGPAATG